LRARDACPASLTASRESRTIGPESSGRGITDYTDASRLLHLSAGIRLTATIPASISS
jgi:hypothetical protein